MDVLIGPMRQAEKMPTLNAFAPLNSFCSTNDFAGILKGRFGDAGSEPIGQPGAICAFPEIPAWKTVDELAVQASCFSERGLVRAITGDDASSFEITGRGVDTIPARETRTALSNCFRDPASGEKLKITWREQLVPVQNSLFSLHGFELRTAFPVLNASVIGASGLSVRVHEARGTAPALSADKPHAVPAWRFQSPFGARALSLLVSPKGNDGLNIFLSTYHFSESERTRLRREIAAVTLRAGYSLSLHFNGTEQKSFADRTAAPCR